MNSTEQLEGLIIKVNWANGTSERYHYAEIFKVVPPHPSHEKPATKKPSPEREKVPLPRRDSNMCQNYLSRLRTAELF